MVQGQRHRGVNADGLSGGPACCLLEPESVGCCAVLRQAFLCVACEISLNGGGRPFVQLSLNKETKRNSDITSVAA